MEIKRAYQSKGLLGYKVFIDGFNNNFDASNEQMCRVVSGRKSQTDQTDRSMGYSRAKRPKMSEIGASLKQFKADQPLQSQYAATIDLNRTRHPPRLAQRGLMGTKLQPINLAPATLPTRNEGSTSRSEISNTGDSVSLIDLNQQFAKLIFDTDSSSMSAGTESTIANPLVSVELNEGELSLRSISVFRTHSVSDGDQAGHDQKAKQKPQEIDVLPSFPRSIFNAPIIQPSGRQKLRSTATTLIIPHRQEEMSSADAYLLSSTLITADKQQRRIAAKRELLAQIEQSLNCLTETPAAKTRPPSVQVNRSMVLISIRTSHFQVVKDPNLWIQFDPATI